MITHEQASILRAVKLGAMSDSDYLPEELHEFFAPFDDYGRDPSLNSDGERVLAAYDAHYTAIERSELERLQALERKIEAFLGAIEIRSDDDVDIDIGDHSVNVERLGPKSYSVTGPVASQLSTKCSIGDAMRKAFEMFEVPGEGL